MDFGHYETRSGLVSLGISHGGPTTKFMGHATSCRVPESDIELLQPLTILVLHRAKKKVGFTSLRDILQKRFIQREISFVERLSCMEE